MQKIIGQIKRKLKPVPPCESSEYDIPEHLVNTPETEEDGFCLIGQTRSERSTVSTSSYDRLPSYEEVTMGSSQSQNNTPSPTALPTALSPPAPSVPPTSCTPLTAPPPSTPPATPYSDVPFLVSPSVAGVDAAWYEDYPHITPINWNKYQYDFNLERSSGALQ